MTVAEILKKETDTEHQRLEKEMYVQEIFNGRLSFSQYCELIEINYIVSSSIEPEIHRALPAHLQNELNIVARNKISALEKDRNLLGFYNAIANKADQQQYENIAEALGAMYVMEGATLGGNVIAKQLRKIDALKDQPFYFYTIYGQQLRANWMSFIEILNREVSQEDLPACIDSAKKTFDYFYRVHKSFSHRHADCNGGIS